jgi:hypothetical protein
VTAGSPSPGDVEVVTLLGAVSGGLDGVWSGLEAAAVAWLDGAGPVAGVGEAGTDSATVAEDEGARTRVGAVVATAGEVRTGVVVVVAALVVVVVLGGGAPTLVARTEAGVKSGVCNLPNVQASTLPGCGW